MIAEMPRDTALLRLREPIISRLDLLKLNHKALTETMMKPGEVFVLSTPVGEFQFTRDELQVGLAYLRISKQL